MNILRPIFFTLILVAMLISPVVGQTPSAKPLRFDIKATKKRTDVERTQTNDKNLSSEKWLYHIEIHNATFADQTDLTVEYRAYKRDDRHGIEKNTAKIPLKKFPGSEKIASLLKAGNYEFNTKEIDIDMQALKAGWTYNDGSKEKVKDSLYGIWIRILKNNEIVSEYTNPPALKTKAEW